MICSGKVSVSYYYIYSIFFPQYERELGLSTDLNQSNFPLELGYNFHHYFKDDQEEYEMRSTKPELEIEGILMERHQK
jgi:hypothetical protein